MKKLFKDSSGRYPSAVEEEKAVRLCQSRLEEANEKLVATKKYARVLQRELSSTNDLHSEAALDSAQWYRHSEGGPSHGRSPTKCSRRVSR